MQRNDAKARRFQLTRLLRGVTHTKIKSSDWLLIFQLTRLLRGVTVSALSISRICTGISTHTPLARRDFVIGIGTVYIRNFNSHASCEA